MTARIARMNHNIYDKYIAQARAQELVIAVVNIIAPSALSVQSSRFVVSRNFYVSNTTTDDDNEDDDNAFASTTQKIVAIIAVASNLSSNAFDQIA